MNIRIRGSSVSDKKIMSFFEILFHVVFLLITFSGSTAIKKHVPVLFIAYIGVCACMALTKQGKAAAFVNRYKKLMFPAVIVLLFCGYLAFQLRFAYVPSIVKTYIRRYFILAFLFVFIPRCSVFEKAVRLSKYYSVLVAASIIILSAATGGKSGGFVGSYQSGGMMMSIACIIFLIDYYEKNSSMLNMAGLLLCATGLLISGKRMFTIIVLVAFVIIHRSVEKEGKGKKTAEIVILAAVGLLLVLAAIPQAREFSSRLVGLSGDTVHLMSGRNVLWEKALVAFKSHKLFGIGFGAFQIYFGDNYNISGIGAYLTHNIYLGLLSETGIVGTAIYLALMVSSLTVTLKARKRVLCSGDSSMRYVYLYSLLLQVWFIVYGISGNGIYDANETFFYFSAIAMMLSVKRQLMIKDN